MIPPLRNFTSDAECFEYYQNNYCRVKIFTFDNIRVFFSSTQFADSFYESANRRKRDKSIFSTERAARIDWIRYALESATAELYVGWDRDRKVQDHKRRVALVVNNYVVTIQINQKDETKANFITAYIMDEPSLTKLKSGPRWTKKEPGDSQPPG